MYLIFLHTTVTVLLFAATVYFLYAFIYIYIPFSFSVFAGIKILRLDIYFEINWTLA